MHSIIEQLNEKYDVIDVIDCDLYGAQWIDLYIAIKKVYRTEYLNDQRIVFKISYDYYDEKLCGKILQSIQTIINDIDISNFFVIILTTNTSIEKEYQDVYYNHNTDSVPFTFITYDGKFERKNSNNIISFNKFQSFSEKIKDIEHLSKHHVDLLFKSETFCLAPWTSLAISTDDKVRMCCEYKEPLGNSKHSSLEEIWNNKKFTNVRQQMLIGKPLPGCENCYVKQNLGRDTLRNSFNRRFAKHVSKVDQTSPDGKLENFELVYLDSRFNNLCNLSCRSCNPSDSSSWHKPAVELGIIAKDSPQFLSAGRHKDDLINQLKKHVSTIESVYFAGGEPLIIEEFYELLNELDKFQMHNVELIYNTNLTKSKYKGKSIFDSWKKFNKISIGASLDAEGKRAEYLRCGTKWKDVVDFRKKMLELRPDIDFSISATTSIINALHVPDFHKSWVEQKLITPEQFNIQLLFSPDYLKVNTAPPALKEKIKSKYKKHLEWLRPLDTLGRASFGFESIIKQLDTDNQFDRKLFWDNVNSLDNYYNTDLLSVFPELEDLK